MPIPGILKHNLSSKAFYSNSTSSKLALTTATLTAPALQLPAVLGTANLTRPPSFIQATGNIPIASPVITVVAGARTSSRSRSAITVIAGPRASAITVIAGPRTSSLPSAITIIAGPPRNSTISAVAPPITIIVKSSTMPPPAITIIATSAGPTPSSTYDGVPPPTSLSTALSQPPLTSTTSTGLTSTAEAATRPPPSRSAVAVLTAGIVALVVALLIVILVIAILYVRRKKKQSKKRKGSSRSGSPTKDMISKPRPLLLRPSPTRSYSPAQTYGYSDDGNPFSPSQASSRPTSARRAGDNGRRNIVNTRDSIQIFLSQQQRPQQQRPLLSQRPGPPPRKPLPARPYDPYVNPHAQRVADRDRIAARGVGTGRIPPPRPPRPSMMRGRNDRDDDERADNPFADAMTVPVQFPTVMSA